MGIGYGFLGIGDWKMGIGVGDWGLGIDLTVLFQNR